MAPVSSEGHASDVSLFAVDFDETISVEDTISRLPQLAAKHRTNSGRRDMLNEWKCAAEDYYETRRRILAEALGDIQPTEDPRDGLVALSDAFRSLETSSLDAVEEGGFLRGIRRDELERSCGDVVLKDEALDVLTSAASLGLPVHVVSVNWSADLIRAAIGDVDAAVHSSDLVFNSDGVSTGELDRRMVSAVDKQRCLRELRQDDGSMIFVGDGVTDLLALLEADVGILIGGNADAITTCRHFGVPLRPLASSGHLDACDVEFDDAFDGLYVAKTWREIRQATLGHCR